MFLTLGRKVWKIFSISTIGKMGCRRLAGRQDGKLGPTWHPSLVASLVFGWYQQFGLPLPSPDYAADTFTVCWNLMDIGNCPNWLLTRLAAMQNGPFPFALAPIGASSPSRRGGIRLMAILWHFCGKHAHTSSNYALPMA